ncbi:MAG: hypothetical protein ACRBF0_11660 [Calditrichia bacterium]
MDRNKKICFLTRSNCSNSQTMYEHLIDAIKELRLPQQVEIIDVGELPAHDCRTGYGTPTILLNSTDLFGVSRPAPAAPT